MVSWNKTSVLDPDPAFYLHADPDHGQTFKSQNFEFLHEKYTQVVIGKKNIPTKAGNKVYL